MAKLATPRLIDVAPSPVGLKTVGDRLTEVGMIGSPLSGVRVTIRNEQGALSAALMLTVVNGEWADCTVAVSNNADVSVIARVNRLLNGYTVHSQGLTTLNSGRYAPPVVKNYWRTKHVSMFHGAYPKITALPAIAEGKPSIMGSNIALRWTKRGTPVVIDDNVTLGYAPVLASLARPRRTSSTTGSRAKSGIVTTTRTTSGGTQVTTAKFAAPEVQQVSPTPVAPTPLKVATLPAGHPGIFQMPKTNIVKLHTDQVILDDLSDAVTSFLAGKRTAALLRGPSGAGKTLAAQTVALRNGLPFRKFDVAGMRDFGDWTGTVSLRETTSGIVTDFSPSQFAEAIMVDGPYGGIPRLVLLDEITRAETAGSMNGLTAILDGTGTLYVPDARKSIHIDPMVMFVFTANIGASFTGTVELDEAIANRITHWVVVDYPSAAVEANILIEQGGLDKATADKVVAVATTIRAMAQRGEIDSSISTRQLVEVANRVTVSKRTLVDAFRVSYIQRLSPEGAAASDVAKVTMTVNAALR